MKCKKGRSNINEKLGRANGCDQGKGCILWYSDSLIVVLFPFSVLQDTVVCLCLNIKDYRSLFGVSCVVIKYVVLLDCTCDSLTMINSRF